jgi:hypothetical protein
MRKFIIITLLANLSLTICKAQKIDNLASFRDIKSTDYFRFNYDNDFFSGTDKNYTQGYSLELVAPSLKKNPINYLFYKPKDAEIRYGLAIEHIGFTPNKYELTGIQFGDRPYSTAIMLKSFMIANDSLKSGTHDWPPTHRSTVTASRY